MLSILVGQVLAAAMGMTATGGSDFSAAMDWVSLVDAKRWDDSWGTAGTLFKSQMSQTGWVSTIAPVRDPLGAVSSRSLKSVTKATSLPGVPDGQYEVVQYQTSFAHKNSAIETVVLAYEPSGWKVDGYFIR